MVFGLWFLKINANYKTLLFTIATFARGFGSRSTIAYCLYFLLPAPCFLLLITHHSLLTLNLYSVTCLYFSPGFKMVLGKDGWLGLSG